VEGVGTGLLGPGASGLGANPEGSVDDKNSEPDGSAVGAGEPGAVGAVGVCPVGVAPEGAGRGETAGAAVGLPLQVEGSQAPQTEGNSSAAIRAHAPASDMFLLASSHSTRAPHVTLSPVSASQTSCVHEGHEQYAAPSIGSNCEGSGVTGAGVGVTLAVHVSGLPTREN
jgi:hypothetical protein